jgi:hypothetical protein
LIVSIFKLIRLSLGFILIPKPASLASSDRAPTFHFVFTAYSEIARLVPPQAKNIAENINASIATNRITFTLLYLYILADADE